MYAHVSVVIVTVVSYSCMGLCMLNRPSSGTRTMKVSMGVINMGLLLR